MSMDSGHPWPKLLLSIFSLLTLQAPLFPGMVHSLVGSAVWLTAGCSPRLLSFLECSLLCTWTEEYSFQQNVWKGMALESQGQRLGTLDFLQTPLTLKGSQQRNEARKPLQKTHEILLLCLETPTPHPPVPQPLEAQGWQQWLLQTLHQAWGGKDSLCSTSKLSLHVWIQLFW